jgi:CO/xanthine dehydrogenase Mo-binding subunit
LISARRTARAWRCGPYSIEGIGENPITPVTVAIVNAVDDVGGARIHDLPVTAKKVYNALMKK